MPDEAFIICMKGAKRLSKANSEIYHLREEAEEALRLSGLSEEREVCTILISWDNEPEFSGMENKMESLEQALKHISFFCLNSLVEDIRAQRKEDPYREPLSGVISEISKYANDALKGHRDTHLHTLSWIFEGEEESHTLIGEPEECFFLWRFLTENLSTSKAYQVTVTSDTGKIFRKWNHEVTEERGNS